MMTDYFDFDVLPRVSIYRKDERALPGNIQILNFIFRYKYSVLLHTNLISSFPF
jgi:hypothetical protein